MPIVETYGDRAITCGSEGLSIRGYYFAEGTKDVAFHDDLAREETGKMCKRMLRAPYWEKAGRSL